MKRFIILLYALLCCFTLNAQIRVKMEKSDGIYKIPCTVNGVKVSMYFDTGASYVSMSKEFADFLIENNRLSKANIIGQDRFATANGTIVESDVVLLKEIDLNGYKIYNVEASIIGGADIPLLFGQSAISKLGKITIDGDELIINNSNTISSTKMVQLGLDAVKYDEDGNYYAVIECLKQLESVYYGKQLSAFDQHLLSRSYFLTKQYEECIKYCELWLNNDGNEWNHHRYYDILELEFLSWWSLGNYKKAIAYYEKMKYYENLKHGDDDGWNEYILSNCFNNIQDYNRSIEIVKVAIRKKLDFLGKSQLDIMAGKIKDEDLGIYLSGYSNTLYTLGKSQESDNLMILSSKCGYKNAIDYCNKNHLFYKNTPYKLF